MTSKIIEYKTLLKGSNYLEPYLPDHSTKPAITLSDNRYGST